MCNTITALRFNTDVLNNFRFYFDRKCNYLTLREQNWWTIGLYNCKARPRVLSTS
jgi:hypothetical protein